MKHLGFWLRWSWRDLRSRWLQVILIALIIALGTGMATGMSGIGKWRMRTMDLSSERLHLYDLHMTLADGSYVPYDELLTALDPIDGVETIEGRLVSPALIDASTAEKPLLVRGRMVGVDVTDNGPHVSSLYVKEGDGRTLTAADSGQPVAVLETKFANHNGIAPGQTIHVSGDFALEVVGLGVTPEYFAIIPESGSLLSEASFAVVFMPLQTLQNLSDRAGLVNDAGILLAEGADQAEVQAEIEATMSQTFPGIGFSLIPYTEEYLYSAMQDEVKTIEDTWSSIGTLFLLGAAVGAFNLIGRMVESQRRQIGIGMALGVPRRWIAFRPVLVGLQIALLGTILGPLVGLALSQAMADLQMEMLSLPYSVKVTLNSSYLVSGIIMGIMIPIAAVLLPIWRAVRVAPVDAITSGYLVARGGGMSRLADLLPLPGKSFTHMPIRNLLRSPWRTLLTIVGIAIAILLLTVFAGLMDCYVQTMEKIDNSYTRMASDRIMLTLDRFYPIGGDKMTTIADLAAADGTRFFTTVEPALAVGSKVSYGAEEQDILLELHDMAAAVWTPDLLEGSLTADQPGIVLSQKAAEDLGVSVGETVTLTHLYRESALAFRQVETDVTVIGIHDNPLRHLSYMDWSGAAMMGLSDATNYLVAMPGHGLNQDTIRAALMQQAGVTSVQTPSDFLSAIKDYLSLTIDMVQIVQVVMLALAFIIAFNSTSINLDERVRDVATMFAFGLPVRTVTRMQMLENLVIGIFGTLFGVLAGLPILNALMKNQETMAENFKFVVELSPATLAMAVGLGILVVALTPVFSIRRMLKMDIPSTLRVME